MLSPYRVLDLTDDRGHLAGLVLAQLGADVIAVEPPGGQRSRRQGPFADDDDDIEKSLTHWGYNRGKRSVVLNDPSQLVELASTADILVECGAVDVDLGALREHNPALITVSITPFGEDGPKAGWAATDLTIDAASGTLGMTETPTEHRCACASPKRGTSLRSTQYAPRSLLSGSGIAPVLASTPTSRLRRRTSAPTCSR